MGHAMSSTPSLAEATVQLTAPSAPYAIATELVLGRPLRCWATVPKTIRELLLGMRRYEAREYLLYEGERLTYGEAFERVCTLATRLRDELGIRKGDRVAIAMRNYPEWVIAFWATTSLGAIAVPLNAWWTGEELAYGLSDSGSRVLIADADRAERVRPHRDALPLEHVIVTRPRELADGERDWDALLGPLLGPEARRARELPAESLAPDDDATIFYTSGTTGSPKGALGTHRNLCTNVGSAGFVRARAVMRKGGAPLAAGEGPQPVVLLSVPLFHVTGCHSTLAFNTFIGGKIVLMYKWSPERALELIERERVTSFGGVPSMAWQVLESPELAKRDVSSITGVNYGGAPSAPELVRKLAQAFPAASPYNGYGLTETSALATTNTGVDYQRKPDSAGPPLPVCDIRIVGEDGRDVAPGEIGELWIRGPNVVKGYWNKPEATAASFTDGFLHTGDVVRVDDEGFVYLLDRAKDMVIRGGENVYCVEVENVLYQHPDVVDAAVVGVPHRILGEEVVAAVQVSAGATTDEAALRAYAAQHLAGFKVPVRIDLRHEPLPRNANGKILKRTLRDELTAPK
jgi:long-chain acyl-CoA synthetase